LLRGDLVASRPCVNVPSAELLRRIRAEYLEMPGLRLTAPQAQRLFGLEAQTCDAVLATLLEAKFLTRTHTGLFARSQRN
jgi:Fic family protein